MRVRVLIFLLSICLLFVACDSSSTSPPDERRYFEFFYTPTSVTFVTATSDPQVIQKVESQLTKPTEERDKHINGAIVRGTRDYNPGYPWHFVQGEWTVAESSIEVCDGKPSAVSKNLDYWVDEVGRFCPFSSRVKQEVEPQVVSRSR
jgi:hypothetical protein